MGDGNLEFDQYSARQIHTVNQLTEEFPSGAIGFNDLDDTGTERFD